MSDADWLRKLTNLNKARGNAPHKPLLLLVYLELVEKGEFAGGNLLLTPDLAYRFDTYFQVVKHRRSARPDVRLPFHHLSTQDFWSPRNDVSEGLTRIRLLSNCSSSTCSRIVNTACS